MTNIELYLYYWTANKRYAGKKTIVASVSQQAAHAMLKCINTMKELEPPAKRTITSQTINHDKLTEAKGAFQFKRTVIKFVQESNELECLHIQRVDDHLEIVFTQAGIELLIDFFTGLTEETYQHDDHGLSSHGNKQLDKQSLRITAWPFLGM